MMRRLMTILATATLVLGMLSAVAEAHGGGRMGGLGASQIGFGGHPSPYGLGLHHHTLHQLWPGYGVHNSYGPNCYFPKEFPKYPPWPPFCS
jgi:hypothetical protein